MTKRDKEILTKKMIDMQNEINKVRTDGEIERRKMKKDFNRKIYELKILILGDKKDIKELYRRSTDNTDEIEKLQNIIQWTFKTIAGVIITVTLTAILNVLIGFF